MNGLSALHASAGRSVGWWLRSWLSGEAVDQEPEAMLKPFLQPVWIDHGLRGRSGQELSDAGVIAACELRLDEIPDD